MTYHDQMLAAYLEAAVWTDQDELEDMGADFSKPSHDQASKDCARFLFSNPEAEQYDPEQVGHDLWLTRNHHGAGFWDRPEIYGKANADTFTEYAHRMGERYVFQNDQSELEIE